MLLPCPPVGRWLAGTRFGIRRYGIMAETLQADAESDSEAGSTRIRWYACHTKSRHEKRVAAMMEERGIETYLPLVPRFSQWKDRKKLVEWPLFPSYVFIRIALLDSYLVLGIPGVATLVKSGGRPAPIEDCEIENVRLFARALQGGDIPTEPRPFYAEGDWVEVQEGPLAGVRGVVVERRGRRRVLIGLKAIGQGMEVDIPVNMLRGISSP
jgi:transcription antitermination factor NusG